MAKNRLKRAFVSKQLRKKSEGACKICGEERYELLDVHRIQHGQAYSYDNTVVLCTSCHRLHHAGQIQINGWFNSTAGRLLHYIDEEGSEQFL